MFVGLVAQVFCINVAVRQSEQVPRAIPVCLGDESCFHYLQCVWWLELSQATRRTETQGEHHMPPSTLAKQTLAESKPAQRNINILRCAFVYL